MRGRARGNLTSEGNVLLTIETTKKKASGSLFHFWKSEPFFFSAISEKANEKYKSLIPSLSVNIHDSILNFFFFIKAPQIEQRDFKKNVFKDNRVILR